MLEAWKGVPESKIGITSELHKKKMLCSILKTNQIFLCNCYLDVAINAWNSGSFFSATLAIFSAIPQLFKGRS